VCRDEGGERRRRGGEGVNGPPSRAPSMQLCASCPLFSVCMRPTTAAPSCVACVFPPCQISRRAWAGNENARFAVDKETKHNPSMRVTMAYGADPDLLASLVADE
jgi:hypothetical protein